MPESKFPSVHLLPSSDGMDAVAAVVGIGDKQDRWDVVEDKQEMNMPNWTGHWDRQGMVGEEVEEDIHKVIEEEPFLDDDDAASNAALVEEWILEPSRI